MKAARRTPAPVTARACEGVALLYARLACICGGLVMAGENRIPREIRLALDRRASAAGRRQAAELSSEYGNSIPSKILRATEFAFRHTARRVLSDSRIGGNSEALLTHMMEVWNTSFTVELGRQRRKADKGQGS